MATPTRRTRARYRSTVLLSLATAAALGAVVWSNRRVPDSVRDERHLRLLRSLRREAVTRVERVASDGSRTELFKEETRWFVSNGQRRFAGDDAEVERVLSEAEYATPTRRLGALDASMRSRYGLDTPRARVTLREARGISQTFSVGGAVEGETAVYVETEGQGFVLPSTFGEAFLQDRSGFRDKLLSGVEPVRTARVEMEGGEQGRRVLEKRGPVWVVLEPTDAQGRASRARVDALLQALRDLRATRFVLDQATPGDLARLGLDHPSLTVRATRERSAGSSATAPVQSEQWQFGGPCPGHDDERTVRHGESNSVACVGRGVLEEMQHTGAGLRDDRALWARADEVDRVRVHTATGEFSVRRESDHWNLEGAQGSADADSVENWLRTAEGIHLEARVASTEAAAHGLAPGDRWIEITRTGVDGAERLWLGNTDADRFYARREGESEVLAFAPAAGSLFTIDASRFRPRRVWRDVPDELRLLSVEGSVLRDEAQRSEGTWRLIRPFAGQADPPAMHRLGEDLASLDADRWVSLTARPEHGLATPRARITVRFEGNGPDPESPADAGRADARAAVPRVREFTLTLGAQAAAEASAPAGTYASISSMDGVFVLENDLVDRLLTPHVDRAVLEVDRDHVTQFEITRGAERVVVRRDGSLWRTGDNAPADRARVDALFEAIALVRAPQVTGYGPAPAGAQMGALTFSITHELPATDAGAASTTTRRITLGTFVGNGDDAPVYARVEGLDATLTVPRSVATTLREFHP